MGDTLGMEVIETCKDLPEAAFDLAGAHSTLLDGSVEIATGTELHHLTPATVLILNEIDSLDDVDVMQRRRDTELSREFLDVLLLGLVLAALAELLRRDVGLDDGVREMKRKQAV